MEDINIINNIVDGIGKLTKPLGREQIYRNIIEYCNITGSKSIPSGTATLMDSNIAIVNGGKIKKEFYVASNGGIVRIPLKGLWGVSCLFTSNAKSYTSNTMIYYKIIKTGGDFICHQIKAILSGTWDDGVILSCVNTFNVGDEIFPYIYQNSGSATNYNMSMFIYLIK